MAGGQDVRQLLLQVDASVALAQRNLGSLRQTVDRETTAMEGSLQKPEVALERLGRSFSRFDQMQRASGVSQGQYRAGMQQLSFQIGDISQQLALGTPLARVFAQQSGQVIQAIQVMQGGAGGFAAFMGGPWGVALTAAAVVLAPLIAALFDTRTELQKAVGELEENARKTELNRQAQEIYARSIPGVVAAIRAQTEALEAQNRTAEQSEQIALRQAATNVQVVQGWRDAARQYIIFMEQAVAAREAGNRQLSGLDRVAGEAALNDLRQGLQAAREGLRRLEAQVQSAQANARGADASRISREVDEARNPREAEAGRLRRAEALLLEQYRNGVWAVREYRAELRKLRDESAARIRQIEAAERDARPGRADRTLMRPVAGGWMSPFGADRSRVPLNGRLIPGRRHQAVDIGGNIGDPVVAPEGGQVRRVGNRPGGWGIFVEIRTDSNARDVLAHLSRADVAIGDRVTAGQVVGLLGNTGNARGGQPHLHHERRDASGNLVDPARLYATGGSSAASAAAQAAAAQRRAAEETARNRAEFERDMTQAQEQLLQARRAMAETVEQQLGFELAQIETDRQQRATAYEELVRRGQRTEAEAILFDLQQQEIADTRAAQARQRAADAIAQQRIETEQEQLQHDAQLEQLAGQLAETRAEQLASALRLAELQRERELKEIEGLRIAAAGNEAELRRLDARERFINDSHDLQRQMIGRQHEGPRDRYLRELRARTADVDTQLEELDVRAMQALDDHTKSAIKSMLGLHGALGDIIADLAMIFIRQQALALLGDTGGGGGGLFSSLGSFLGAKGGVPSSNSGIQGLLTSLPGRAGGGPVLAGHAYLVGERGPEPFVPSVPGTIIPNHMLGGGARGQYVRVEVVHDGDMFRARVVQASAGVVASAAPAISASGAARALKTSATRQRRRIPTGF